MAEFKQPKVRKCKFCKKPFQPDRNLQSLCSWECASGQTMALQAKRARKERKDGRKKLKTHGDHVRDTEKVVHEYIRYRDKDLECISCGTNKPDLQYQAGHYWSKALRPAMRFMRENIHRQCARCNGHLKGNYLNYRLGLIKRYGLKYVEELDKPHPPAKLTVADLAEIRADARRDLRILKHNKEV